MSKAFLIAVLVALAFGITAEAARKPPSKTAATRSFTATAYCLNGRTESGSRARSGTIAADPRLLPVGSVVRLDTSDRKYAGVYTVRDTGSRVNGLRVDIFIPDCRSARTFGRRQVRITLLRRAGQS